MPEVIINRPDVTVTAFKVNGSDGGFAQLSRSGAIGSWIVYVESASGHGSDQYTLPGHLNAEQAAERGLQLLHAWDTYREEAAANDQQYRDERDRINNRWNETVSSMTRDEWGDG